MLKRRVIPVLFIKNGLIIRSEGFKKHQLLGNVISEAQRYNSWDVDELIYIDISTSREYDLRRDDHKIKSQNDLIGLITEISKVCFMPLCFGGGIRTLKDVDEVIINGADKVVLNTGAFINPHLITEVSEKYGNQCVVVNIDYKVIDGTAIAFSHHGKEITNKSVIDWALECERLGAGEIFVNSIDRDGSAEGYDIQTIKKLENVLSIPLIACGGAMDEYDLEELAKSTNISGLAAGNYFHFTEQAYPRTKKHLKKVGINVR